VKLYPKIRIHTWGGLGSQLLGVALCIDIQARFPRRTLQLVHHTSGVTERKLEIDFKAVGFEDEMHEDFHQSNQVERRKDLKKFLRGRAKFTARFLNLHSTSNTDREYLELKPWVLSIRGHYSHRALSDQSLRKIANLIGLLRQVDTSRNDGIIAVHYRLGDLVDIHNKSYIHPITITQVVSESAQSFNLNSIRVYSDSPEIAWDLLGKSFQDRNLEVLSRTTVETIYELVNSPVFVGTNSKISVWVAILRDRLWSGKSSFLPMQLQESFQLQNPSFAEQQVFFYDSAKVKN